MRLKEVFLGIFTMTVVGSLVVLWLAPSEPTRAPALTVTTVQGEELAIPDPHRRAQLVVFWATSCPACIREIPHLIDLHQELALHGLQIIAIAMPYDRPDRVIALGEARDIPYPLALDIRGSAALAFGDVRQTPTSFLISPDGHIVQQRIGTIDVTRIRERIIALLGYPKTASLQPLQGHHRAVD